LKNDVNVASKSNKQKKLCSKIIVDILKVNDEYSRIRIQDPDPDPNPDPLVRGMDPRIRIRIRIHPQMSWIRNTEKMEFVYLLMPSIRSRLTYNMATLCHNFLGA
jgi:hypothetical protein